MSENSKKNGPFEILSTKIVYQNPWIRVREDSVIRPGGSSGIFGIVEMVSGSSVLPITKDGMVYLVSEHKYGIERESLEVISGALDSNETPLDGAIRELQEELGLTAGKWTELGVVDPFTTVIRSPNFMFLAEDLRSGPSNPDEGEEVYAVKYPLVDALNMVMSGKITHSASCVLILKAARILGQ